MRGLFRFAAVAAVLWGAFSYLVIPPKTQVLMIRVAFQAQQEGRLVAHLEQTAQQVQQLVLQRLNETEAAIARFKAEDAPRLAEIAARQATVKANVEAMTKQAQPILQTQKDLDAAIASLQKTIGTDGDVVKKVDAIVATANALKARVEVAEGQRSKLDGVKATLDEIAAKITPLQAEKSGVLALVVEINSQADVLGKKIKPLEDGVNGVNGNLVQQVKKLTETANSLDEKTKSITSQQETLVKLKVSVAALAVTVEPFLHKETGTLAIAKEVNDKLTQLTADVKRIQDGIPNTSKTLAQGIDAMENTIAEVKRNVLALTPLVARLEAVRTQVLPAPAPGAADNLRHVGSNEQR